MKNIRGEMKLFEEYLKKHRKYNEPMQLFDRAILFIF